MENDFLSVYTIYRNPSDYPGRFVVREVKILNGKTISIDPPYGVVSTLEEARGVIPPGLSMVTRSPNDDFNIVESWL